MRFYLQFGHGMIEHCRRLLGAWRGGGVILSPRDLIEDQLERVAADARRAGAEPLLDPQCYLHDADHHRLTQHQYWQVYQARSTASLLSGSGARDLIRELGGLSRRLRVERNILPGLLARPVDDSWLSLHEVIIEAGAEEFGEDSTLATVALSVDSVRDEEQVEAIVERAADWPVAGFYVVAHPPTGYLVEDPAWLANVLILTSGLQLLGKPVLFGYGNHQMLALAAANVDTIAAGTWLNVRAFPPAKFYMQGDEDRRRSVWFYCSQALTEYQPQFLDMAQRHGVLEWMRPDPTLGSNHADPLFAGPPPSTVRWREPQAFRHYLTCLHGQCRAMSAGSFEQALQMQRGLLESAQRLNSELRDNGVFARTRDFGPIFDVNRSALIALDRARGARLRREWR
ncbi:MAG: hypothetical protein GY835_02770 [bacterium]|nr:hypothetical protein [bacterium]